tara:strand:- start:9762 stop:10175 length:414 start_codon:yes stop_codon:yes gene_type:complete
MYAKGSKKKLQIGRSVNISNPSTVVFGDNVVVNADVYLVSSEFPIIIGNDCLIAPRCFIQTLNHNYERKNVVINKQGYRGAGVFIEEDCWLAYGTMLMPGVTIRKGSVLSAGSVVTKSTESYGVYAGVPAKKIKERV